MEKEINICRNGERFWVTINHERRTHMIGTVNNYVFMQPPNSCFGCQIKIYNDEQTYDK